MTTIDGVSGATRLIVNGVTAAQLDTLAERTGMAPASVVRLLVADAHAKIAPPVEDPAPPGVVRGQGTTRPPAPTIAHVHVDPDGDRLTLLAIDGRPCDWSVVLTTADGEVERDVLVEDDEDLAKIALGWLTAIDRRER